MGFPGVQFDQVNLLQQSQRLFNHLSTSALNAPIKESDAMKRGTTNSDAVRRVQNANPGVSSHDLYHTIIVTN